MTTITIDRATVEQALEALESVYGDSCDALHALRAALAQQAEPDAYGYASRVAVSIWQLNYKDTAPNWKPLDDLMGVLTQIDNMTSGLTRRAQQAEPVAGVVLNEEGRAALVEHGREEWHCAARNARRLYTAPPQRKPLPNHDQHCVDVPGYGLMAVRLVRAVERAHGIGGNDE